MGEFKENLTVAWRFTNLINITLDQTAVYIDFDLVHIESNSTFYLDGTGLKFNSDLIRYNMEHWNISDSSKNPVIDSKKVSNQVLSCLQLWSVKVPFYFEITAMCGFAHHIAAAQLSGRCLMSRRRVTLRLSSSCRWESAVAQAAGSPPCRWPFSTWWIFLKVGLPPSSSAHFCHLFQGTGAKTQGGAEGASGWWLSPLWIIGKQCTWR